MQGVLKRIKYLEKELASQTEIVNGLVTSIDSVDVKMAYSLLSTSHFENPKVQTKILSCAVVANDSDLVQKALDDPRFIVPEGQCSYVQKAILKYREKCTRVFFSNERFLVKNKFNWLPVLLRSITASSVNRQEMEYVQFMLDVAVKWKWDIEFDHNRFMASALFSEQHYLVVQILECLTTYPKIVYNCQKYDILRQYLRLEYSFVRRNRYNTSYTGAYVYQGSIYKVLASLLKFPELDVMQEFCETHLLGIFNNQADDQTVERILNHPNFDIKKVRQDFAGTTPEIRRLFCGHSLPGQEISSWKWNPDNWDYFPEAKRAVYENFLRCVYRIVGTTRLLKDLHEIILTQYMPAKK